MKTTTKAVLFGVAAVMSLAVAVNKVCFTERLPLTNVNAADYVTEDGLEYYISDWDDSYIQITGYSGDASELVIPAEIDGIKVQEIGYRALSNCSSLVSVSLPDTISEIDSYAFNGCSSLEEIIVSSENENFVSLDGVLFSKDMTKLIRCPGKMQGEYIVPEGVERIGTNAFAYCEEITSVILPSTLTYISGDAFSNCIGITEIEIPNGVTDINDAFRYCYSLKSITIPESVEYMNSYMFAELSALEEINIDENNQNYSFSNGMFYKNSSYSEGKDLIWVMRTALEGDVTIEDGVIDIGYGVFSNLPNVTSVNLPASVEYINWYFGADCPNLTAINVDEKNERYESHDGILYSKGYDGLVDGLKVCPEGKEGGVEIFDGTDYIGGAAFENCRKVTNVTIPDSVRHWGWNQNCFVGCISLEEIDLLNTDSTLFSLDAFGRRHSQYNEDDDSWTYYMEYIPFIENLPDGPIYFGTTLLGFKGDISGQDIEIKPGTAAICDGALSGSGINSVKIPASAENIGRFALDDSNISSIEVEKGNPAYFSEDGVLYREREGKKVLVMYPESKKGTSFTVPNDVDWVYGYAFSNNNYLEEVILPKRLSRLGDMAFAGCEKLKRINMPEYLSVMEYGIFSGSVIDELVIYQGTDEFSSYKYSLDDIKVVDAASSVNEISNLYNMEKIIIRNENCKIDNLGSDVIICGYDNSTAQAYAKENGNTFESLGEAPKILYGDANCDGKVTIADSTAILQALGNSDKYGLSALGAKNADCCNTGDGVKTSDALAIQKLDAKILKELPEVTDK